MALATAVNVPHFGTAFRDFNAHDDDDDDDFDDYQSIPGSCIDATKLLSLLRMKFGAGTYDMHIVQNSYCVAAPRRLSKSEIAQCRRR
ncbi:hypothetical protein IQ06DRAFT_292213 [Phaeosphaeriaceae sp. SRC1lsM3a]|nr:hypothetical protein IQ06DRAFT_292213 [Stagonospora sp. SRC1lsM3a]